MLASGPSTDPLWTWKLAIRSEAGGVVLMEGSRRAMMPLFRIEDFPIRTYVRILAWFWWWWWFGLVRSFGVLESASVRGIPFRRPRWCRLLGQCFQLGF
jgi:hypothetical protein